jgi:LPPG:FO 2-phospho-L-lactate transferase
MKITALAGGIGASKLLLGLQHEAAPESITIIANTGDDIELHGLRICPDIDTVIYTLSGLVNPETGWGLAGDSFDCLTALDRYGVPTWFKLGDRDLATHIFRSEQLALGQSLSEVTDRIRRSLGVRPTILPMSNSYVPTRVITGEGDYHLQEYFVQHRCEPKLKEVRYSGVEDCESAPGVLTAINEADVVIVCPSNPIISIGPILAVPGVRSALVETPALVAAVTPIVNERALKGPTAEMLRDLGHQVSPVSVARMYADFLDLFVLDSRDLPSRDEAEKLGLRALVTNTVMNSLDDKRQLARELLDAVESKGLKELPISQ